MLWVCIVYIHICIYIYEVRKIPPMMVTLMKASATTFYQIFMLHEGDALTEGKTRKTEGTRKQLRKDLATFQKHGGHGRTRKGIRKGLRKLFLSVAEYRYIVVLLSVLTVYD